MRKWLVCKSAIDPTGTYTGPLRIVGSARCAWNDLRDAPFPDAPVMAVKAAGLFVPECLHWVGLHREHFVVMREARHIFHPLARVPQTHSWKYDSAGVDCVWHLPEGGVAPDLSGCFALMVALMLGYSPIVLCGIPHTPMGHFYDPFHVEETRTYEPTNNAWFELAREHAQEVYSQSGWTKRLFDTARKEQWK